jgi:hypothetical protein
MLYYPQLSSGSVAQYPVARSTTTRTVSNQLQSGDTIRMSDLAAEMVRWQLGYAGLSDAESSSISQLFAATEGRLNTFTFLDPTDNLLMWSEDWTNSVWAADPLLQVVIGIADPDGGTGAIQITNTAQANQQVTQSVAAASWFQYCYSIYLRSDSPCSIQLLLSSTDQQAASAVSVGSTWVRAIQTGPLTSQDDGLSVGLILPPGVRMFAFGPQLEAQPAPGPYKRNTAQAGVYPATRFDADSLSITADAVGQSSCAVKLVTHLG